MKKVTLFSILMFVLIATPSLREIAYAQSEMRPYSQSSAYDLIAAVNSLRSASGLPPYTVSSILMGTAQGQADFMASTGSVTHTGPGGISLTQRLLNAGYPLAGDLSLGGFRAENITAGPNKTANQAIQEWLGDSAHINTMLSPNLQEIGAGVAVSGGTVYYVIDCAQPTTSGAPQAYTPSSGESTNSTPGEEAVPQYMAPVLTATPDADGLVYHNVLYGQSLWSLAIAYGVKIDDIRNLNNLSPDYVIQTGDRLLVRKDVPPPRATSTVIVTATIPVVATSTALTHQATATTPNAEVEVTMTHTPLVISSTTDTSTAGIAVGIVLVVLLLVGAVTWMNARKPV